MGYGRGQVAATGAYLDFWIGRRFNV